MIASVQTGNVAILLAAGGGSRFGGGKLTASWHGEAIVTAAARAALAGPFKRILVVTGADADAVAGAVLSLADPRLTIVHNQDWAEGIAASLRCGLAALPSGTERVAIFLGDMPLVDPALASRLLPLLAAAPAALAHCAGRPLHPVVFSRVAFPRLAALRGDAGARDLLSKLEGVVRVEVSSSDSAFDVDTAADLTALRDRDPQPTEHGAAASVGSRHGT